MFLFENINTLYLERIQNSVLSHLADCGHNYMVSHHSSPGWYIDNVDGLKEFLTDFGILENFARCFFMTTPPNLSTASHIDISKSIGRKIGLNIPIFGTANTSMIWYNAGVVAALQPHEVYGEFPRFEHTKEQEIGRLELLTPAFVRTDIPHIIENRTSDHRIILSITCEPDLGHRYPEEIKKTKHYQIEDFVVGDFYQF